MMLTTGFRAGVVDDGEQLVERADQRARTSDDPTARARLGNGIGSYLMFTGRPGLAIEHLRETIPFADASRDADISGQHLLLAWPGRSTNIGRKPSR